jgi:hypothetical protein
VSAPDKSMCVGCRNDFYNGQGAKECWSFKSAQVVQRWRIGWWTQPTSKSVFRRVTTLNCHQASGKYSDYPRLPKEFGGDQA